MGIWSRISSIFWGEWGSTARRHPDAPNEPEKGCPFVPGQMVTPKDRGKFKPCSDFPPISQTDPQYGVIYTVTAVFWVEEHSRFYLKLKELSALGDAFSASSFRPVKQTSIEIFRQILVSPPKSPVREDA